MLSSVVFVILLWIHGAVGKPRNIVFIVADDLGWNDVGFHNPDMITPNIDKMAAKGVRLNSAYVQPVCTPSRHAWMTGEYPFKAGLQRNVILPKQAHCSPLDRTFLPQKLKQLGYDTHMAGKWHLGFCNWNCTPTYRGFDSFLGYYNGAEDYYTKMVQGGVDFHDNETPLKNDEYSPLIYASRAVDIISEHDKSRPLFLYLPFQSVHSPIQVPKRYEDMYPHIKTKGRRQYCGMVSALDEAVGNVTDALEKKDMMGDTLIIFTADNGGMPRAFGNNYPLRGAKSTVFEGGTRAASFVYGSGLEQTGYSFDGLFHAVDWNPTIIGAAGGQPDTTGIDGINLWESISKNLPSRRTELVYNLDNALMAPQGHAAIRVGDFKLIQGFPGPFPEWYKPDEVFESELDFHNASVDESQYFTKLSERMVRENPDLLGDGLYNLRIDPNEHDDISAEHPEIVKTLKEKLDQYRKELVPPKNYPNIPASNPSNYDGFWSPGWC